MRKGTVLVLAGVISLGVVGVALWQLREPIEAPPTVGADPQVTQQNEGAEPRIVAGSVAANRLQRTAAEPFVSIARRAEAGDPAAQRLLGERYLDCLPFSLSPEVHKQTLRALAELRGLPEATATIATTGIDRHCGGIDGGQPIPLEAGFLWLEQAAKAGDLVAQAKLAALKPNETPPDEVNDLLASAILESNPDALLSAAPLLGATSKDGIDPRFASYVGSPNDEYAWAIAACRMGADCGPTSHVMTELCLSSLYCGYSNYEQFIRAEVLPDAQLERVDRILAIVRGGKT